MLLRSNYEYEVTLSRVIDGDTLVLCFDLGFKIRVDQTVRLYGINTPELIGESAQAGQAAKDAVMKMLSTAVKLRARTHKMPKHDKYGRYLAEVVVIDAAGNEKSLNETLLAEGHAVPYLVTL